MEKIKQFLEKNKRLLCAIFSLGSVALGSAAAVAYRERKRRTDIPTAKYDSREGSVDKVDEGIRNATRSAIERAGENLISLEEHQRRAGELNHDFEVAIGELQAELDRERERAGRAEDCIRRARAEVNRIDGFIDRIQRVGRSDQSLIAANAGTIESIERELDKSELGSQELARQFNAARNTIGAFKGILSELDG